MEPRWQKVHAYHIQTHVVAAATVLYCPSLMSDVLHDSLSESQPLKRFSEFDKNQGGLLLV